MRIKNEEKVKIIEREQEEVFFEKTVQSKIVVCTGAS